MNEQIPILRVGAQLLVTLQVDLTDSLAEQFQEDLLGELERTRSAGVVVDISGLETVDSYVARVLADTGQMARLMGARMVLVGMRPSVASTLVRLGVRMKDVEASLDVESGLALLRRSTAKDGP